MGQRDDSKASLGLSRVRGCMITSFFLCQLIHLLTDLFISVSKERRLETVRVTVENGRRLAAITAVSGDITRGDMGCQSTE